MHAVTRTLVLVTATFAAAFVVACSGSDGEPVDGPPGTGEPTILPPAPTTTATSTSPTEPPSSQPTTGTTTKDAGTDAASGGAKALGEACTRAEDCQSGACFVGNQSGYCSLKCTQQNAATVCKAPVFDGQCNTKGFCRKP
jgi:hypothetical protein